MMGYVTRQTLTRVAGSVPLPSSSTTSSPLRCRSPYLVDVTAVNNAKIFGIPLGVIIGLLAVFIGVLCLVRDFDAVRSASPA